MAVLYKPAVPQVVKKCYTFIESESSWPRSQN